MADTNDGRGAEQQRPQGQLDSNFYANNNLDVRIAPQQWQADANARAQQHVPVVELPQSDTRNGANKYAAQQNPALVQDSTKSGADKYAPQLYTPLIQDRNRTNTPGGRKPDTAPRPESAGPKMDTSDVKWGTNNKSKTPDNKLKGESAPKSAADAVDGEQTMEKTSVDPHGVDPNKGKQEKLLGGAKDGEEHIDKSPADAANPNGEEHIDKSPADATEDESAGSYQGGSSDSSQNSDSGNSRAQRSGLEQEQERARTAYEAVTGTSAPRVFNSIGEAMSEGQKTANGP